MVENSKIRFAIIGCGHIGKRHAAVIVDNKECELAALCDVREKESLGLEQFHVPFFNSIDTLLASDLNIDVLSIATPNGLHEEHSIKGLAAGKHIVIEKPMALTKSGCENIISKSLLHHKLVFCVMQNRYSPPSQWLKGILEKEILGKIFMVQVNCYWNRDNTYYPKGNWHGTKNMDGGTLFTQFSHFIDIINWLFGDITNIHSRLKDFNHQHLTEFEDSGFVSFDFITGGMGSLNYSTSVWKRNLESSITIIAEMGSVKVGGQYMNELDVCNIKDYEMPELEPTNAPNNYGSYRGSAGNHQAFFQNVVDVLKNRVPMTTNAQEAMKVVEIIEKIYAV